MNNYIIAENYKMFHSFWKKLRKKWTWRESNPRPETCPMSFYYHSQFFFISSAARKRTSLQLQ